jgi:nucleotide-binding universal stress UspA family protein
MSTAFNGYKQVLVATDFSTSADAALRQAVWLGNHCGAKLVLSHCLDHLRRAAHTVSYKAKLDLLTADGALFQKEIREESDRKLRQQIAALNLTDLDVSYETLLGEPFVEITHAVLQEGYDLVLSGTHGRSGWKGLFVGSTAKRLIGKCPSAVWIVKAEHANLPRVILAPCDFSDVSRKAVRQGLWLAEKSNAEFHLLHVIDSKDVPDDLMQNLPEGSSVRDEINQEATQRLQHFLSSLDTDTTRVQCHLSWGVPWKEIGRIATKHGADLIAMGTVGRSGIKGVLLGNTAERVLETCDCSILTVKPDDYVSPIAPATWPLHP